jgi:hypothetical protein
LKCFFKLESSCLFNIAGFPPSVIHQVYNCPPCQVPGKFYKPDISGQSSTVSRLKSTLFVNIDLSFYNITKEKQIQTERFKLKNRKCLNGYKILNDRIEINV